MIVGNNNNATNCLVCVGFAFLLFSICLCMLSGVQVAASCQS